MLVTRAGGNLWIFYAGGALVAIVIPAVAKGIGIVGQPQAHYYFHRPLGVLLTACFDAGFVMDGFIEPTADGDRQPARPFSWTNFMDEIPGFLVARMRLPSK